MKKYTLRLAQKIFAQAAGDPVLLRIVDDGKHPEQLYIDLANESIAAALTFEDAWSAEVARERESAANRRGAAESAVATTGMGGQRCDNGAHSPSLPAAPTDRL